MMAVLVLEEVDGKDRKRQSKIPPKGQLSYLVGQAVFVTTKCVGTVVLFFLPDYIIQANVGNLED